jgi:diaminohydroxyphosphoribosylaminopyrimidine deaminase / 5-amino-6-(5-phosphoribosylamino)uracil reductase
MHCDLPDDFAWPALLTARTLLAEAPRDLVVRRRGGEWVCERSAEAPLTAADEALLLPARDDAPLPEVDARALSVHRRRADGTSEFVHPGGRPVDPRLLALFRVYAPVLGGAARARHGDGVFVVGHLTQTLDGRIACSTGGPQWIGNEFDRRHAHRMRALLDGVMVGAATALGDDPQLTVRAVRGPNPRRIVLSGSGRVLRAGRALRAFANEGCDVLVAASADAPALTNVHVERIAAADAALAPRAILAALRARGVHSLYLEGGACTLSSFLQAGCLDLLQIHVAPIVLGSGLPSFQLPPLATMREAHAFAMQHATLGGDVLLSCWPQRRGSGA